ncbi:Protein phosphatase 2C 2 [Apophysomyces ossiformis]|uniref:protein-serine/threonine phosphatase n=1 Tax=Apophysomyces ossiformis TaxID=679940 RepID=A0A8H7BHK9_9FUNG|nr:Protein phosphatase 2C 2 [Apophysomyces ossiformis]
MEDAHTTLLKLEDTDASFFGVYDGHGGSAVAKYTGQSLHRHIRESPHFDKKEYKEALKDGFLALDKELSQDRNFEFDPSGCTAVTALVTPDNRIFVANAGDSRSVISINGESTALSYDHKPVNRLESQRIIAAGGYVEFGRVNGNLALSRAIGDFEFKQNLHLPPEEQIVTCNPDIIEHEITNDDEFFVLACDGIWDCMTNQQVVSFIRAEIAKRRPLEEICELIMDHCLASDSDVSGVGCDNMSIMIVGILHGKTEDEWYDWIASRAATKTATEETPDSNMKDTAIVEKLPEDEKMVINNEEVVNNSEEKVKGEEELPKTNETLLKTEDE